MDRLQIVGVRADVSVSWLPVQSITALHTSWALKAKTPFCYKIEISHARLKFDFVSSVSASLFAQLFISIAPHGINYVINATNTRHFHSDSIASTYQFPIQAPHP